MKQVLKLLSLFVILVMFTTDARKIKKIEKGTLGYNTNQLNGFLTSTACHLRGAETSIWDEEIKRLYKSGSYILKGRIEEKELIRLETEFSAKTWQVQNYLLMRMLNKDPIALILFERLFGEFAVSNRSDKDFMKQVFKLTFGISNEDIAFYIAYKTLDNMKPIIPTDCSIVLEKISRKTAKVIPKGLETVLPKTSHLGIRQDIPSQVKQTPIETTLFLQNKEISTRIASSEPLRYYSTPLSLDCAFSKFDKSIFPIARANFANGKNFCDQECNDSCQIENEYTEEFSDTCSAEVIGPMTHRKGEMYKAHISTKNGKTEDLFFYIQRPDDLYYNCIGWSIGFLASVSPEFAENGRTTDVKTIGGLKTTFSQLAMAVFESKRVVKEEDDEKLVNNARGVNKKVLPNLLMEVYVKSAVDNKGFASNNIVNFYKIPNSQFDISKVCKDARGKMKDNVVIFYGLNGGLTHAARYISHFGKWTSKMGILHLITHSFDELNQVGSGYGEPKFFYCPGGVSDPSITPSSDSESF